MKRSAALALSLAWTSALQPALAIQWQPVPPLPPLPQNASANREGLNWLSVPSSKLSPSSQGESPSPSQLNWHRLDTPPAELLAWDLVPDHQVIDPEMAIAADEAREQAYKPGKHLISPFRPHYYTPYLGGAEPTAYVDQWGEGVIAGYAGLPNVIRDFNWESAISLNLGLGDPDRFVAISAGWDIGSTKNLNANGAFALNVGRVLVETPRLQITAGGGVDSLGSYGNESGEDPTNGWGVVTFATPLRPNNPDFAQLLQFSFGIGGNDFAPSSDGFIPEQQYGGFMALGLQATPGIGISFGRSGRGANAVVSLLPDNELPFYVEVMAIDLFNETPGGTKGVLGVRFGGRNLYRPRQQ